MLAIMLLKASEPGWVVVGAGGDVVDVVAEEVGTVLVAGFKGGGSVPSPSLKFILKKIIKLPFFFPLLS